MIKYDVDLLFQVYAESPQAALKEIVDRKMVEQIAQRAQSVSERVNLAGMLPTSFLDGTPHDEPPGQFGWLCLVGLKVHE